MSTLDTIYDEFNSFIGRISQNLVPPESPKQKKADMFEKKPEGFFETIGAIFSEGIEDLGKAAIFEKDKAFKAYNIKVGLYNALTITAIGCVAGAIFGSPYILIGLVACLAGRVFISRAMDRTFWGAVGNHHQVTDRNVHSLLFKSFIPTEEKKLKFVNL